MMKTTHFLISLAVLTAGCGAVDGNDELPAEQVAAGKADNLGLPAPGDTAGRVYFGSFSDFSITDDQPLNYQVFTARGGTGFTVDLQALNDDADGIDTGVSLGFKLYRLAQKSGKRYWKLISSTDGPNGEATFGYTGSVARWYMVESAANTHPAHLSLNLYCDGASNAACALAGQPRDACTPHGKLRCDRGLYCQFAEGSCGGPGVQGTCVVSPTTCPQLGLACFPVCGCDGNTYCQGCDVTSNRVSILHTGTCDCDPTQYSDGGFALTSTMAYIDPTTNSHYTYQFKGVSGFNSVEEPGCAFATPRCLIKIAPKNGSYAWASPTQLVLSYDDGTTATFTAQVNCNGAGRLTGTDYGVSIVLTPQ